MEMADWFEHRDIVTADLTRQEFIVWDPWYNRLLRRFFGGHNKRLKSYNEESTKPALTGAETRNR